jgi:hypothetical protein
MPIKKQIYIIILISLLLSVFLTLFLIFPLISGIYQDSEKIISQKNNILLSQTEFNAAKNFQAKYESYKPNLDRIDQMFVDSKNLVDFMEFVEKTAFDSGTKVKISTPFFSQDSYPYFANLQIVCSGDFSKVIKFINAIETGKYLIQVQNLNVVNYKEDLSFEQATTGVSATISIKVFVK